MRLTTCRGCYGSKLSQIFSLGIQHLSDFPSTYKEPPRAPLALVRCGSCSLVQLDYTMTRAELYHDRYGYVSGVNEAIRRNLETNVQAALRYVPHPHAWLDVASNDGTLLSFVPQDTIRVGIDPVAKFAPLARGHANLVIADFYHPKHFVGHKFDVITAVSVFYDLSDPRWFIETAAQMLSPQGVLVIQQNYLGDMLENTSFDNICHEHLTYFSLSSLKALLSTASTDLEIIEVVRDPINGGCIRTVLAHRGQHEHTDSGGDLWTQEIEAGMHTDSVWAEFTQRVLQVTADVRGFAKQNAPIMIYGASTRGAVIWQAAGLDQQLVSHAVEAQAAKVGTFYAALGPVPIISEREARELGPRAMLVGPYWHKSMFINREQDYISSGGQLAFPLPELDVWTAHRLEHESW